MSNPKHTPLERLKHHITGAIERGEKIAIEAVITPKHTPGPWKVETHAKNLEVWNQNTHIATMNMHYKYEDQPAIDKANAHLIAAAPELLESLGNVIGILENYTGDMPNCIEADLYGPLKDAYAAIAKATGGAE